MAAYLKITIFMANMCIIVKSDNNFMNIYFNKAIKHGSGVTRIPQRGEKTKPKGARQHLHIWVDDIGILYIPR